MPTQMKSPSLERDTVDSDPVTGVSTVETQATDRDARDVGWDDVTQLLWARKLSFILVITCAILLAFVYLRSKPQYFEATTILTSASSASQSERSGLAQLQDMFAGRTSGNRLGEFATLVTSKTIATIMEEKNHLIKERLSGTPQGFIDTTIRWTVGQARMLAGREPERTPVIEDLTNYIISKIDISMDQAGMLMITARDNDPQFCAWLVNTLVLETDTYMKRIDRLAVEANLTAMESLIQSLQKTSQREFAVAIMEDMLNRLVLTNSDALYVVKALEPATVPLVPAGPRISITLAVSIVLGMAVWLIYVLVYLLARRIGGLVRTKAG